MNLLTATPTEYVWKYNPVSGNPAGAQQNYGSTVDWVLPGGTPMATVAEELRRRLPQPAAYRGFVSQFEARSDQQPYANARETNYIAATVLDSGRPKSAAFPVDLSGRQRSQLAGGFAPNFGTNLSEGRKQLAGGRGEGVEQLSGGLHCPPRWCGIEMAGNGVRDNIESLSDSYKYFLRTQGPSQVMSQPGVYSRREFMTTFVPAAVPKPFESADAGDFPGHYSSLYKGRTAYEDTFWTW